MSQHEAPSAERRTSRAKVVLFALLGLAVMTAAAGGVLLSVRGTGSFDETAKAPQKTETARDQPAQPKP